MNLISLEKIEEIKNQLVIAYNPLAIYIFGSYAWGTPNEVSDLDLMIVVKESDSLKVHRRAIEGYAALRGVGVPKELIVLTEEEFNDRSGDENRLAYKVKTDGKCIYTRS